MRYSDRTPINPVTPVSSDADNRSFVDAVRERVGDDELTCAILLVGGRDERSLALRRAQSVLRYDRLQSYWSHAALIVDGRRGRPPRGLEVTLDPTDSVRQSAARNGVTVFDFERYYDQDRYPNLALFCLQLGKREDVRQGILDAALAPNRERVRYPFWDQLATWARHAYNPDGAANPLSEGIALPSAAYCEYAYGAARIDLTPGAVGNHASPELLWATMKHWSPQLEAIESVSFRGFAVIRDAVGTPLPPLPELSEELGLGGAPAAAASPPGAARVRNKARPKATTSPQHSGGKRSGGKR